MSKGRARKSAEPKKKPEVKRGRPPALVADDKTIALLRNLAKIQCTKKEAAAVLEVSEPTFHAFIKQNEKAFEAWEYGAENGRASLRRTQFQMAEKNAAMAIWLGKQYLGQKDQSAMEHNIYNKTENLSDDELEAIARSGRAGAFEAPTRSQKLN